MIPEPEIFDAVVVGGGPAGTAAALALRRAGCSVAVLERTFYDDVRLGETVPPEIRSPLTRLGVWERFLAAGHRPSMAFVSAWGSPELACRDFLFSPWGHAWHLDRCRFDAMLATAAEEAGALVLRGAHVGAAAQLADRWRVSGMRGDRAFALHGRYLLDATGRAAGLVRKLGGRLRSLDRLVGLAAYLEPGPTAAPLAGEVLLEAAEDGWWYSAPLPGQRAVAAFLTDSRAATPDAARWWSRLGETAHTSHRLADFRRPSSLIVRPAQTRWSEPPPAPRFLAIGDAAAAFDPLSSQGILKALRSGLRAAEAVVAHRAGECGALMDHQAGTARETAEYLALRAAYYGAEDRWPRSTFWRSRRTLGTETRPAPGHLTSREVAS